MTKEEYEEKFVTDWLHTYHTAPTIADALEWQRKTDIEKACEWLLNNEIANLSKLQVKFFRKAMEK